MTKRIVISWISLFGFVISCADIDQISTIGLI